MKASLCILLMRQTYIYHRILTIALSLSTQVRGENGKALGAVGAELALGFITIQMKQACMNHHAIGIRIRTSEFWQKQMNDHSMPRLNPFRPMQLPHFYFTIFSAFPSLVPSGFLVQCFAFPSDLSHYHSKSLIIQIGRAHV